MMSERGKRMPLESIQMGRYRILRTIGTGSMGEVYLVEDSRINRQVAIKVIRGEGLVYADTDPQRDAARLFEREAKAIARLNHPNILPLYDFGEEVVNGTPLTYMVMPYCPDGSLASWLQQRGQSPQLSLAEVEHFQRQAGDALQHAHDNGIIHQDVKPQNFLLRANKSSGLPDLLLADFGIAKLAMGTSGASQAIRGTPIYMAPEQWEGNPQPASDQYALAIMLYIFLTGRPPFEGGPGQMMYKHFSVIPQAPSVHNPALSPNIDMVILRALAKKPEERYPTVADFSNAFQQAALVDAPTFMQQPSSLLNRPQGGISAPLTISAEEAANGTMRVLTLPGGRRVRVAIPSHIQSGQVVSTMGQDIDGGAAIPLALALTVAAAPEAMSTVYNNDGTIAGGFSGANRAMPPLDGRGGAFEEPTIAAPATGYGAYGSNPNLGGQYTNRAGYSAASPYAQNSGQAAAAANARRSRTGLTIAIIVLVVLLIFGSVVALAFFNGSRMNTANTNATATSSTNNSNATGTADANGASTASANARATNTASANARATNTASANTNATATAAANTNATATAAANNSAHATATAAAATASATVTLTAPTQTQPANNTTFPTGTTSASLQWSPVQGAASYTVQVSRAANNGTCGFGATLVRQEGITGNSYTFAFDNNPPYCWRVWAVGNNSQQGPRSGWSEFSYMQ
jgi:serine/threonine protein kinase